MGEGLLALNLSPREKLTKARVKLNDKFPFFGYLSMRLRFKEDDEVKQLSINKSGLVKYNKEYVEQLSVQQLTGALSHMVMHCAMQHFDRKSSRQSKMWDLACDLVVNGIVEKNNIPLPNDTIKPNYNDTVNLGFTKIENVSKKSADDVYHIIQKDQDGKQKGQGQDNNNGQKQQNKQPSGGGNQQQDNDKGFDKHEEDDTDTSNDGGSDDDGDDDDTDVKKSKFSKDKDEIDWEKAMVEAATSAKMQGKTPRGVERLIDQFISSEINWKGLLYRYITNIIPSDYTWKTPHKKSHTLNTYFPDIKREKLDIVVDIDTSGSISKKDLTKFLSEILGITRGFEQIELTILFSDTDVYPVERKIRNPSPEELMDIKPRGGGGTDHRPVFEWVGENKPHAKLLICFTDGWTTFPESSPVDTIWVLHRRSKNPEDIPFGKVVKLPDSY